MTDLAIVIPSRGRPAQCARLVEHISETATAEVLCVVIVDHGDPTRRDYAAELARVGPDARLFAYDGTGHVAAINAGAKWAAINVAPAAIAKFDDDHWPVTESWDVELLAELGEVGEGIVYGDDMLQGENLPTAPIMSAGVVRALGWMGPPILHHLYVDNFWRDLGRQAGCLRYVPSVIVEHRHALNGKAPVDEGYLRVNAPEGYQRDGAAYQRFLADPLGMARAVRTVKALRGLR